MVILKMVIWPRGQNFRPLYLGPQRSQKVVILDFGVSYIGEQMWQISSKSVGVRSRGWLSWHGMTPFLIWHSYNDSINWKPFFKVKAKEKVI